MTFTDTQRMSTGKSNFYFQNTGFSKKEYKQNTVNDSCNFGLTVIKKEILILLKEK